MSVGTGSTIVAAPTSVTAGAAAPAESLGDKTVTLEGSFTGTYQLQISADPANPPAATSWISEQAALTAAGNVYVQKSCFWVRWNCTAYTSGTPVSRICGILRY